MTSYMTRPWFMMALICGALNEEDWLATGALFLGILRRLASPCRRDNHQRKQHRWISFRESIVLILLSLQICLDIYIYLFIYLSIYLSVCLSVHLSIIYLFIYYHMYVYANIYIHISIFKKISFGGIPNSRNVLFLQIFLKRAAKPSTGNTSAGFP